MKYTRIEKYIHSYELDGKNYYRIYITKRSPKLASVRAEKKIFKNNGQLISDLDTARKLKEKWVERLVRNVTEKESVGITWKELVEAFEMYWKKFPSRSFNDDTLRDHISRAYNFTEDNLSSRKFPKTRTSFLHHAFNSSCFRTIENHSYNNW